MQTTKASTLLEAEQNSGKQTLSAVANHSKGKKVTCIPYKLLISARYLQAIRPNKKGRLVQNLKGDMNLYRSKTCTL